MLFLQWMPRNDPFHPPKPILIVVKIMTYFLQGRSIRRIPGGRGGELLYMCYIGTDRRMEYGIGYLF